MASPHSSLPHQGGRALVQITRCKQTESVLGSRSSSDSQYMKWTDKRWEEMEGRGAEGDGGEGGVQEVGGGAEWREGKEVE